MGIFFLRLDHFLILFYRIILLELIIIGFSLAQWVHVLEPGDMTSTDITERLVVCDTSIYAATGLNGILKSSDNGASWTKVFFLNDVTSLAVSEKNIFAGVWAKGIFISTDEGKTWNAINNGLSNKYISALLVSDTALYAGTQGGVFLYTKTNTGWIAKNIGLSDTYVTAFGFRGTTIYAGTEGDGIYSSRNSGETWTHYSVGHFSSLFWSIAFSGSNIIAGTWDDGVFISSDCGRSWRSSNSGLTSRTILSFCTYGTNVFVGTGGQGVFLSTDHGVSWNQVVSGLPMDYWPSITSLTILGPNIFAGAWGPGVWRRPLSEMITSVEQDSLAEQDCEILPDHYSLQQNCPNPFNSSTKISFSLPSESYVTIKVYDLLGREVFSVLSTELYAGDHVFQLDTPNLVSGIYFCRLHAAAFTSTIKMILIK